MSGGARGVGLKLAAELARTAPGAGFLLAGRSAPGAGSEAALALLRAAGARAAYLQWDVSQPAPAALADARASLGPITALLHAAGRRRGRSVGDQGDGAALPRARAQALRPSPSARRDCRRSASSRALHHLLVRPLRQRGPGGLRRRQRRARPRRGAPARAASGSARARARAAALGRHRAGRAHPRVRARAARRAGRAVHRRRARRARAPDRAAGRRWRQSAARPRVRRGACRTSWSWRSIARTTSISRITSWPGSRCCRSPRRSICSARPRSNRPAARRVLSWSGTSSCASRSASPRRRGSRCAPTATPRPAPSSRCPSPPRRSPARAPSRARPPTPPSRRPAPMSPRRSPRPRQHLRPTRPPRRSCPSRSTTSTPPPPSTARACAASPRNRNRFGAGGIVGWVRTSRPGNLIRSTPRAQWAVDPLALDGAFQLAGYWAWTQLGRAGFPIGIEEFASSGPLPEGPLARHALARAVAGRSGAPGTIVLQGAGGKVVAVVRGIEGEFKHRDPRFLRARGLAAVKPVEPKSIATNGAHTTASAANGAQANRARPLWARPRAQPTPAHPTALPPTRARSARARSGGGPERGVARGGRGALQSGAVPRGAGARAAHRPRRRLRLEEPLLQRARAGDQRHLGHRRPHDDSTGPATTTSASRETRTSPRPRRPRSSATAPRSPPRASPRARSRCTASSSRSWRSSSAARIRW